MAASHVHSAIIENDLPQTVRLLSSLTEQVVSVTGHIRDLMKKVEQKTFLTSKGLSLLDLRYHLLLFYLQDLTHVISLKAEGQSLQDHGAIHRLVTVRTVLEKMRPLDQKLKYQIDKLVKTAVTGSLAENDPLHLRPNPENLVSKLDQEWDEDEGGAGKEDFERKWPPTARKYIPPKIAPMHYDGDLTESDRQKELQDKQRKAALRSSVIQELRQQYSDAPEEIRDRQDFQTDRDIREEQHRRNYEESMMVRLSMSRDQRAKKRRMMGISQLNSITHFSDITALTGGEAADTESSRPKKKKKMLKKKNKKKMFKKRK